MCTQVVYHGLFNPCTKRATLATVNTTGSEQNFGARRRHDCTLTRITSGPKPSYSHQVKILHAVGSPTVGKKMWPKRHSHAPSKS